MFKVGQKSPQNVPKKVPKKENCTSIFLINAFKYEAITFCVCKSYVIDFQNIKYHYPLLNIMRAKIAIEI